jgi:hypothetical protein
MITIGLIRGGPEQTGSAMDISASILLCAIAEARGSLEKGSIPFVNIVFDIAGFINRPSFEGYEYGRCYKKEKGVVVAVSVPAEVSEIEEPLPFFKNALLTANQMAYDFLKEKGHDFPLVDANRLAMTVIDRIDAGYVPAGLKLPKPRRRER